MRWIPVVAWIFTFVGIILSLVTLLSGSTEHSAAVAAIATFNVSSLGLTDYHNPTSELGQNISDLVPSDVTNPPSITKYLGVQDWYSMHYLSVCSGFFVPSKTDSLFLTSREVNVTCNRQSSGYTFSLSHILRDELKPSVKSLAAEFEMKAKSYNTAPWINLWYAGIVFAFQELFVLPFTFSGKRRINMYTFTLALISALLLDISAGLVTGHALGIHRSALGLYPTAFLGLTWSSTALMWVVLCLIQLEWKFQIWTPVGQPIVMYRKPEDASWFAMRPPGSRKVKAYWDVRHGI